VVDFLVGGLITGLVFKFGGLMEEYLVLFVLGVVLVDLTFYYNYA